MVDRIHKVDPNLYRVQEPPADRDRRQKQGQEEEEKKEKDKFDKKKPFWKKLIPDTGESTGIVGSSRWAPQKPILKASYTVESEGEPDESSFSLSQRVLVVWGIVDPKGRPIIRTIVYYAALFGVIVTSLVLILRTLWR